MIQPFMIKTKRNTHKLTEDGFTLIELMVVIAIIGVLASSVLVNLESVRAKARDTQRISDMNEIAKAFELFFIDHQRYPGPTDGVPITGQMVGVGNEIDTALLPYIDPVPIDPSHDAGTGVTPVAGAVYFYGYDPKHMILTDECIYTTAKVNAYEALNGPITKGIAFGFNHAESKTGLRRDTCSGSNLNLNNADYNRASTPDGT